MVMGLSFIWWGRLEGGGARLKEKELVREWGRRRRMCSKVFFS